MVLNELLPKFRRRFPFLQDDAVAHEVLEEAGQRIASYEERSGSIKKLHGFAWVTVRNVGRSRMRRPSSLVDQATLGPMESAAALSRLPSEVGNQQQIELDILLRQLLDQLTPQERMVALWRKAGFSSKQVAEHLGLTVSAVDTMLFRIRQKLRSSLRGRDE